MLTTSVSLLERLRQTDQQEAWSRFVQLYTPLLFAWASKLGLSEADAADLIQEVFVGLLRQLPVFVYDKDKSFRGWLRVVLLNKWRDRCQRRVHGPLPAGTDSAHGLVASDSADSFEEAEYRQYLVSRALQLMQAEFQPTTWQACWEYVVAGKPAADVARELGISVNAVYHAKSRVLARLRQELAGLLD